MNATEKHTLLIQCPDQKGIVYQVTKILYEHNLNVERNSEFVDENSKRFFMRTECSGKFKEALIVTDLLKVLPAGSLLDIVPDRKKRIILFASKEHHCLSDILVRDMFSELNAHIEAVISNHATLEPLVKKFGVPFYCIDAAGSSHDAQEKKILKVLAKHEFDYLVLAKYMRVLSPKFVSSYANRIINIHHSFLPAFAGANPYRQAYQRGVKIIGATAHFVTDELDQGPIIAQSTIPIDHSYSLEDMVELGRDIEKLVLAKALSLVLEDRVFVAENKTVIF